MQKVTCNSCEKDFTIKPREEQCGISIKINYFRCPNCNEKYIFEVTDPESRKMKREILKIREERSRMAKRFTHRDVVQTDWVRFSREYEKQIKAIQRELEPRMNKLKEMYS